MSFPKSLKDRRLREGSEVPPNLEGSRRGILEIARAPSPTQESRVLPSDGKVGMRQAPGSLLASERSGLGRLEGLTVKGLQRSGAWGVCVLEGRVLCLSE